MDKNETLIRAVNDVMGKEEVHSHLIKISTM